MEINNVPVLKIHELSKEQFEREKTAGNLEEFAIYLTPDEEIVIPEGSLTAKGIVKLVDSTSSTSTTDAATPNSVKVVYDLASEAKEIAESKVDENTVFITEEDIDEIWNTPIEVANSEVTF